MVLLTNTSLFALLKTVLLALGTFWCNINETIWMKTWRTL